MQIVIQGLGFVGSAMAVAVASKIDKNKEPIFNVIGIDRSNQLGEQRISSINNKKFPFKTNDKKLSNELKESVERGNLRATSNISNYSKADIVIVSINCDLIKDDSVVSIELDSFSNSIKEIASQVKENTLIIIESTVPPGTCIKIVYPIFKNYFKKRRLNIDKLFIAHSYERVMPGDKYFDSITNYWRVFSGINSISADKCESFLSQIINVKEYPLTKLKNTTSSETGKLLENSYRATNIAFIEEWSRFAEDVGIDLFEIINAIRMRPTHSNIMQPGFGVGGYCLTKDPLFAKIAAKDLFNLKNHDFTFSSQAIKINSEMPLVTLGKIKEYFNGDIQGKKILLMGITYRQDVADTRFSPSEVFYKRAKSEGASIKVYDPMISYWDEISTQVLSDLPKLDNYDVVVFAVPHNDFKEISLKEWNNNRDILIFDANNVLTKKQILEIKNNEFFYMSIGRG